MIKSNERVFQLTVNVMDRIMSTSIILLDQNSNANDVDILVFEPCDLFPTYGCLGGGYTMHGPLYCMYLFIIIILTHNYLLNTPGKRCSPCWICSTRFLLCSATLQYPTTYGGVIFPRGPRGIIWSYGLPPLGS